MLAWRSARPINLSPYAVALSKSRELMSLKSRLIAHSAFPYLAPLAVWALLSLPDFLDPRVIYLLYPINIFAVGLVMAFQLTRWPPLAPARPWACVGIGLFGAAAWIALLPLFPAEVRSPFDPYRFFGPGQIAGGLTLFRILGEGVVFPVASAVFIYGFLMRFFIRVRFETVPLGEFSIRSAITAVLMTVAFDPGHWPGALEAGLVFTVWFLFTRNLGSAVLTGVVAHLAICAHLLGVHRADLL